MASKSAACYKASCLISPFSPNISSFENLETKDKFFVSLLFYSSDNPFNYPD
nr:MAG TPA: hypothetical protein [Caudoviricetes sp.]